MSCDKCLAMQLLLARYIIYDITQQIPRYPMWVINVAAILKRFNCFIKEHFISTMHS